MGTFAFREILCCVLRQSRFRLVHEFSWGPRSALSCRITKCTVRNQLPGITYPAAPKLYSSVLICPYEISNVITMPKNKIKDKSDSKHKLKDRSNKALLKTSSLKHIRKRKKKKKKHHHHKTKHSKSHSPKAKAQKPELILLDSSSSDDSDICILYDSRMKNKRFKPSQTISQCLKNNKNDEPEVSTKLKTSKIVQLESRISDESEQNKTQVESNEQFTLHEVSEQCSVKHFSQSVYTAKEHQDFDTSSAPIVSEGLPSSAVRSNEVTSGPSCGKSVDKQHSDYIDKKKWELTNFGKTMANKTKDTSHNERNHLMFNVLSYNVLCQEILEEHMDLYTDHNPIALDWEYRSKILMNEFLEFSAEVMCLQEVQESHLKSFYSKLLEMGYLGIYKQRTGDKKDGVAIYFKNSTFQLIDYTSVEYYQPGVPVLNRDNVGLIVKLAPKLKPDERIIVATTHLLYNPRRHDVKLAQIQILLAEVERFAFKGFDSSTKTTQYWPVILTGDMNLEPNTGGFELLNMGRFRYDGLSSRTLTTEYYGYGKILGKELIPPYLGVTDTCQHWNIIMQRNLQCTIDCMIKSNDDHKTEIKFLQIYNSDFKKLSASTSNNLKSNECKELENFGACPRGFGSGQLTHTLQFSSVYQHDPTGYSTGSQVSTFQNGWVVVDYIFYSNNWNSAIGSKQEGNMKLVARYKLLSADQATAVGPIPNLSSASDHYPLAAKFALFF